MTPLEIKKVVEAAILVAEAPVSAAQLRALFKEDDGVEDIAAAVRQALNEIREGVGDHGYELVQVASGFRFQARQELSHWVGRLFQERPPRYSRALLETMALIAYRQPVTRGDIEDVRGVSVSSSIFRTLIERGWIRDVGQREVPGRPTLYATTRAFLDYFNLKSLDELQPLAELKSMVGAVDDGPMMEADTDDDDAVESPTEGRAEGPAEEPADGLADMPADEQGAAASSDSHA